jgi:3-oxoacyl-[acyl-carrier protein] reductase
MPTGTAVVTGAGTGLGRAIATALGAAGYRVVCGARDGDAGEAVATEIAEGDGTAVAVRTDVRDEYDVERCCEIAARESEGGVDAVVPAAATDHSGEASIPLGGDSYAAVDDQFRTNARGVWATVREAIPHLGANARVVVPVHEFDERGIGGTYAVSRAATVATVHGFARELPGPVGGVDPGATVPAFDRRDDLDPSAPAAAVRWAVDAAPADDIDDRLVDVEEARGRAETGG